MFQLLAIALFVLCCLVSIGEAITEKDWPRDTFRFVIYSGLAVLSFGIF